MGLERAARWYVYTLADPRDGIVFYVGKGSGDRISAHERDALRSDKVCSRKLNKIRDIQASGLEIGKGIIARFWDEQAAYDHETDLIEEIGLANLTNVLPGGQKAWERRRLDREDRRGSESLLTSMRRSSWDAFFARAAEWFRAGGHEGVRWKITANDPTFRASAMVSEAFYNNFLPWTLERVRADQSLLDVFRERIRPFGVELV